jgi:hypothetical protein
MVVSCNFKCQGLFRFDFVCKSNDFLGVVVWFFRVVLFWVQSQRITRIVQNFEAWKMTLVNIMILHHIHLTKNLVNFYGEYRVCIILRMNCYKLCLFNIDSHLNNNSWIIFTSRPLSTLIKLKDICLNTILPWKFFLDLIAILLFLFFIFYLFSEHLEILQSFLIFVTLLTVLVLSIEILDFYSNRLLNLDSFRFNDILRVFDESYKSNESVKS